MAQALRVHGHDEPRKEKNPMAEFLIAPNAAPSAPHASGRGNEPHGKDMAKPDSNGDMPQPFAAVLKSASSKNPAEPSSETQPEATSLQTDAATAAFAPRPFESFASIVAPSTALAVSAIDSSQIGETIATDSSPEAADSVTALILAAAAPPALLPGNPVKPSAGVSAAPTFAEAEAKGMANGNSASLGRDHSTVTDKLAADTAISAAAGVTAPLREQGDGEFRGAMERAANSHTNALMLNGGPPTSGTPVANLRIQTPLTQTGWPDEMGQRLSWMASNNRQQAELVLNPPQLGRIEITLTLDGDKASASFVSPHAVVRETLENSMMRLREVLADAGVTLGQTHVGAESRENSHFTHLKGDGRAPGGMDGERHQSETTSALKSGFAPLSASGRGLVDVFA